MKHGVTQWTGELVTCQPEWTHPTIYWSTNTHAAPCLHKTSFDPPPLHQRPFHGTQAVQLGFFIGKL